MDRNGLEVLSRAESLQLLSTVPVARIGATINALPVVLPVNFVVHGDEIIIRSAPGTKLTAALHNAVVAIEADSIDPVDHAGWSVMVQGVSRVVEDSAELMRSFELPLRPWANDGADQFIAVSTDVVSGRRLCPWHARAHASAPGGSPAFL